MPAPSSQVFFGWLGVARARFRTIFMKLVFFAEKMFFFVPGITRTGPAQPGKKIEKHFEKYFSNSRPGRPARITEFPFYGSY